MLVLMPIGSKPTSPASVPSSTDGFFRNGMAAERSTIAMLCERIAGRVAGAPLNPADVTSERSIISRISCAVFASRSVGIKLTTMTLQR